MIDPVIQGNRPDTFLNKFLHERDNDLNCFNDRINRLKRSHSHHQTPPYSHLASSYAIDKIPKPTFKLQDRIPVKQFNLSDSLKLSILT